jgi:hypothetical protein
MNFYVATYTNDSAKLELRNYLQQRFTPSRKDCYQEVAVFPALDEIKLVQDKITLILFEPDTTGKNIHPLLLEFYNNQRFKNRVLFLSGNRGTMDKLLHVSKEYKAIQEIIKELKANKTNESDFQYEKANEKLHKVQASLNSCAMETFITLYYPSLQTGDNSLHNTDFLMEFKANHFNEEDQIIKTLASTGKYIDSAEALMNETFRSKCEARLFTQRSMRWQDIKERAATYPLWNWHPLNALENLKLDMLKKDFWREEGGYLDKGPFPKEKTVVMIQELSRDVITGEVKLRLTANFGDTIYYEVGGSATTASHKVENPNEFRTMEMIISFLAIDSTKEHEAGDAKEWRNQIKVKGQKISGSNGQAQVHLSALPSGTIRYTTDGSSPENNGGLYDGPFDIPENCVIVQAIAQKQGIKSELFKLAIPKDKKKREINKHQPLTLERRARVRTNSTSETYQELGLYKKNQAKINDFEINFNMSENYIKTSFDPRTFVDMVQLEKHIENTREIFIQEQEVTITIEFDKVSFNTGQNFLDWAKEKGLDVAQIPEDEIIQ